MTIANGPNTWIRDLLIKDPLKLAKFTRFLVVGLFNAVVGFLLFLLFFSVAGFHYLLSNVLVFISWVWFGFELQRRLVFRVKASGAAFGKHVLNQILFTAVGSALLWVLVNGLNTRPELAYIFTSGIVTAGIYLSSLFWVWGRTNQAGH
jgi:putative flippase GtrA